jgi:hypothetical protein
VNVNKNALPDKPVIMVFVFLVLILNVISVKLIVQENVLIVNHPRSYLKELVLMFVQMEPSEIIKTNVKIVILHAKLAQVQILALHHAPQVSYLIMDNVLVLVLMANSRMMINVFPVLKSIVKFASLLLMGMNV